MIVAARPFKGRRLRARRVDEEFFAERVRQRALEQDEWVFDVDHGGDVANAYKYPAETECVLAVSDPLGIVVYWTARARANKVTLRGAANACIYGAGAIFDARVSDPETLRFVTDSLKSAHRQEVPEMLVIAVAAR